jgi:glycosyltransferase involved in cell wall biosynthesis
MAKICFVGLETLPVLSRDYNGHGIGGEQVQHTLLARAFKSRGHDVSVICCDYGQPDGLDVDGIKVFKTFRKNAGVPIFRFLHPRLSSTWSALKRADADIYYTSCAGPLVGIVQAFAQRYGKKTCFRIAHDNDCDPAHLQIKYQRDKWIYEFGIRNVDAILAQSEQQQQALRKNYGLDSAIAGMLVEPAVRNLGFDERDIDVLWVNNIRQFKRPDLALKLARDLPHLRLHMVGGPMPGMQGLFDSIQTESKTLTNVVFHGRVPYHDVNDLYERAKVFVNTSDSEGFPNSYLQAWRRGTPLVAFFDPDDVVARQGLGTAPKDIEQMKFDVSRLAADQEGWRSTSGRCREFMDERFSDALILEDYIACFEAIAATDRRAASARMAG